MVMNFEGEGSMWSADNINSSLMEQNLEDQVNEEDTSATAARRMLKGKRRQGGKKKARRGKKKARKQKRSFNGKQKKHAQRRAKKAWKSEIRREARKSRDLEDSTTTTTSGDD